MELESIFLQEDKAMVAEYFPRQREILFGSQQQHLVQEVMARYPNLGTMETVLIIKLLENDYRKYFIISQSCQFYTVLLAIFSA